MRWVKLAKILMKLMASLGMDKMLVKSQTQVVILVLMRMMVWVETNEDVCDGDVMKDKKL